MYSTLTLTITITRNTNVKGVAQWEPVIEDGALSFQRNKN